MLFVNWFRGPEGRPGETGVRGETGERGERGHMGRQGRDAKDYGLIKLPRCSRPYRDADGAFTR